MRSRPASWVGMDRQPEWIGSPTWRRSIIELRTGWTACSTRCRTRTAVDGRTPEPRAGLGQGAGPSLRDRASVRPQASARTSTGSSDISPTALRLATRERRHERAIRLPRHVRDRTHDALVGHDVEGTILEDMRGPVGTLAAGDDDRRSCPGGAAMDGTLRSSRRIRPPRARRGAAGRPTDGRRRGATSGAVRRGACSGSRCGSRGSRRGRSR
jgi:hypothetical protein